MRKLAFAQVRAHAGRLIAATLAIVIAVAFVVATLVLNETTRATVLQVAAAQYVGTDVVVTADDDSPLPPAATSEVAAVAGVTAVAPTYDTAVRATLPGTSAPRTVRVRSVAQAPSLRWEQVAAGRLPDGPNEVALSSRSGAEVGDVVAVVPTPGPEGTASDLEGTASGPPPTPVDATVTGIVDLRGDIDDRLLTTAFVTAEQARAWGAAEPAELRVAGDVEPAAVAAALGGGAVTATTGAGAAQTAADSLTGGADVITWVLLAFASVSVLVSVLVIANTFAVVLAQRARELALLRCVGATSAQVRRSVLVEATLMGLAASALGVLVGVGLSAGLSALATATDSPLPLAGLSVPASAVVVGLALGTLVTLLASLLPARAATRVAPLAALRPVDTAPLRSRPGVLRFAVGLVLAVPGAVLLVVGTATHDLRYALAGGVLSFLGVVLLAQRGVPPVVGLVGRLFARSVPARLAAGNATRNPRRTAAVATALLIGVTLTSAMVVGAASTKATGLATLASEYPTDVVVADREVGSLPASLAAELADVPGVAAGGVVRRAVLTGPDGAPMPVEGLDRDALTPVLRSTDGLRFPEPNEILVPADVATAWDVREGSPVTVTSGERSRTFDVVLASSGASPEGLPAVTAADLGGLDPSAAAGRLWLRLADGGGEEATVEQVTELVGAATPTGEVEGLVSMRTTITSILDTVLLVVTGLLAIAVVIAVLGVSNTLALSVVERRQESGLLRALGLTSGQLRGVLAWEAVLVSGVASLLGVALGGLYGLAGATSVLGGIAPMVLTVPWGQVAAIVAVATLAGLAASVLPARRAARISPVAAIAV